MTGKRRLLWIAAAAIVVALAAAFWLLRGGEPTVEVARARIGPAADLVYATGYVEPQQPVSISSRITAPVERVLVEEGAHVHRGQPLALLVDDEQQALVDQAAAQRRAAEQKEHRTVVLFREGWVTKAARDQAVADADAARAAQRTAAARRQQLVVTASIDGIVTKRDVEPGDLATPTKVLFQLGDPARIRVTATVDERDIARVAPGQLALMSNEAWPGRTIKARVSEVTPSGDPNARAFRVRLLPETTEDLPLGITFEINIVVRSTQNAVLVPASALGGDAVWVIADGRVRRRTITRGLVSGDSAEIRSGLRVGEVVVANPPTDLTDGQKVRVRAK